MRPAPDNVLSSWILSCGCCSFNCWLSRGRVRFRHAGDLSASDVGQLDGEDGDSGDAGVADDDVIGGDVKGTQKEAFHVRGILTKEFVQGKSYGDRKNRSTLVRLKTD
eukprot:scpid75388/ scgid35721/ 